MIEAYLYERPWVAVVIWAVLYIGDYYLTIWGAKLYHAQRIIEFEGSYELTPDFQEDIDRLRSVSPTFIIWLVMGAVALLVTGYCLDGSPRLFGALAGFLILPEVWVWFRHTASILRARRLCSSDPGVSGHIVYSRANGYIESSIQIAGAAVFTSLAFAVSGSAFLFGGALDLCLLALEHWLLARKAKSAALVRSKAPAQPSESE
jgi:hypothetical protein